MVDSISFKNALHDLIDDEFHEKCQHGRPLWDHKHAPPPFEGPWGTQDQIKAQKYVSTPFLTPPTIESAIFGHPTHELFAALSISLLVSCMLCVAGTNTSLPFNNAHTTHRVSGCSESALFGKRIVDVTHTHYADVYYFTVS